MEEAAIIKKAQEGNRYCLNTLLEDNYRMLYGFMLKLTGDEELAKDLTQDAMVKAVVNIGQFKGNAKFSTWMTRIAINCFKNHTRKKRISWLPLRDDIISTQSVEATVEVRDQLYRVNRYLEGVKAMDRLIFVLKHYEGYSYDEISEMTGQRVGTCKSKMYYLTEKIKKALEVST